MSKQALVDGRRPLGWSYITHETMHALQDYFGRTAEAKLSTGIALYMGIAYLLSIEEHDGHHQGTIEKTRGEIGAAGGLSATNVTRYAEHLVSALVLELEQQLTGGANLYLWKLVEPPLQIGDALRPPHQIGEAPHQAGDAPNQGGEASTQTGEATTYGRSTKKEEEESASGEADVSGSPEKVEIDADRADGGPGYLSNLLADLIAGNDPNHLRPTVKKVWLDAERLMLEKDNRDIDVAERLVRWSQADEFWCRNIRSMPTFRSQFGRLFLEESKQARPVAAAKLAEPKPDNLYDLAVERA